MTRPQDIYISQDNFISSAETQQAILTKWLKLSLSEIKQVICLLIKCTEKKHHFWKILVKNVLLESDHGKKKKITSCITSSVGKSIIPMIQGCTLDPQSGDIQESMNSMGEKGDFQQ